MIWFYCFIAPAPAVTFVIASTQLHLLDYDLCGLSKYLGFSFWIYETIIIFFVSLWVLWFGGEGGGNIQQI